MTHLLPEHRVECANQLLSPSLIIFRSLLLQNMETILRMAGQPSRLRPHCKTHKIPEIVRLQVARGITKHKAATIAEAEMLAGAGATDVMVSYPLVGPNVARLAELASIFPQVQFSTTVDNIVAVRSLSEASLAWRVTLGVALDINPGRDRTGVLMDAAAVDLYEQIARAPGLEPAGLHQYDGHQNQPDPAERRTAVLAVWDQLASFRDQLVRRSLPVPRIICGGTPTFPVWTTVLDPLLELSPGTNLLHDTNYGDRYPDLSEFVLAALVFTRVISRPTARRVTLDVGTKSVASDPPMGQRVTLPAIPDGQQILHNEEHLVVETDHAGQWQPGDWMFAIPKHICPTSALHKSVYVVEHGQLVAEWNVVGRDRRLTV
ncbi:MAG: D-TA family PLP-dependent enzyme [Planctomycetota bacterium]|nr:MAG: D-TA family PLP-dependent enzyme [Planctomycetota bacterium]